MGMDFIGPRNNISMKLSVWVEIYQLGLKGGWSPRGAVHDNWLWELESRSRPPEAMYDNWLNKNGVHSGERRDDYFSNGGQLIDEIDAKKLANTLEKMLPSIPDMVIKEFIPPGSMQPNGFKKLVREFIDFCREGEIRIT